MAELIISVLLVAWATSSLLIAAKGWYPRALRSESVRPILRRAGGVIIGGAIVLLAVFLFLILLDDGFDDESLAVGSVAYVLFVYGYLLIRVWGGEST